MNRINNVMFKIVVLIDVKIYDNMNKNNWNQDIKIINNLFKIPNYAKR